MVSCISFQLFFFVTHQLRTALLGHVIACFEAHPAGHFQAVLEGLFI